VTRQENKLQLRIPESQSPFQFNTADSRHLDIEDGHIKAVALFDRFKRLFTGEKDSSASMPLSSRRFGQHQRELLFIIYQQNLHDWASFLV
jgi:hypothetical protein